MREGEEGERKVRTWECPKAGRMSLNLGVKFQQYIDSIIIRRGEKARSGEAQLEEQGEARVVQGEERAEQGEKTEERGEKYAKVRKRLEVVIENVERRGRENR
jgi:hypothetical protein